jgi:membrane-bound lytic murein transglycosylase D
MTYPTSSRINLSFLLILLSLSLISCAQTQNGDNARAPLFDFWHKEKPVLADPKPVQLPEAEATADQNKPAFGGKDFFSGLTPEEIEKLRMEAWNTYGGYWKTIAKRSQYVRQPMMETLEKAGAPEELQMIPVVESSYDPYAQSEVGATGLWQLMPLTAKDLRVKSDKFIDGRRGIAASTKGAAKFLLTQRKRFGNWPLAFAAYHLGPGGVQKRLNRRPWTPEDGLDKIPLPPITKTYVNNLLGLIALYQVGELQFPKPFATKTLRVQMPVNLDELHEKAELPKDQLYRFNPELNLKHYYGKKKATITLRVTSWRVPAVKKHISAKPAEFMTISLRKGESLGTIKKRYKATSRELMTVNPGNLRQHVRNGTLRIPVKVLARAKAEKNPLVKRPVRMVASNN